MSAAAALPGDSLLVPAITVASIDLAAPVARTVDMPAALPATALVTNLPLSAPATPAAPAPRDSVADPSLDPATAARPAGDGAVSGASAGPADAAAPATPGGDDGATNQAAPLPAGGPAAAIPAEASSPSAAASPNDLWDRIRRGFRMPDLADPRSVQSTRQYASQPDYISRMAGRAGLYLFHIVEEIERRGMPMEIALLPFVESAMQPEATSNAKAVGLWQFTPGTGRLYSLEQTPWKDDRRDVIESTRAALDYLQALYAEFGDWSLALAAYNCGEASVERALARSRARHSNTEYTALSLPRETQWYVPKLQAIKNIVNDPARYGIALPSVPNEPYFVVVNRDRDMDVATVARLAEMPLADFQALNPAFNRPVIPGAAGPGLLLPTDRAAAFEANLAAFESTGQPLASWTTYRLRPNESLADVARRVGVGEDKLRDANKIPQRYRLVAGSTILIPRDETMDEDIDADSLTASFALVAPPPEHSALRRITYRVRRGDTLATVAKRYRVNTGDLVAWNGLHNQALFPGQRLSINQVRARAVAAPRHAVAKHPLRHRGVTVATAS